MNIRGLKQVLEENDLLVSSANVEGYGEMEIQGISVDTRNLGKNGLFICRKGFKFDSHALVNEAVHMGAVALIVEKPVDVEHVPVFLVNDTRLAEAVVSAAFFGFPHKELKVYGVTGTNGKTTVSTMIHYILTRMQRSGSLLGTVKNIVVDRTSDALNSTPTALEIIKNANETLRKGGDFISMEVSSHALSLKRVESIRFDYAVLTNITQDHLDFHGDMENYAMAKFHLFELLKEEGTAILNADDPWVNRFIEMLPMTRHIVTFGMYNEQKMPDYAARQVRISSKGIRFELWVGGEKIASVKSQLIAQYSVYNILAALALLHKEGLDIQEVLHYLEDFRGVEGRFELYAHIGNDIDLVVDFAHTPDALEKTLETARLLVRNRIIVVFGAGGDADRSKRPMMGQVASEGGDVLVITTDNPKSEKPFEIIRQIESGITRDVPYLLIEDRKMAIETAINIAGKGDMIVLAGKGHERFQIFEHTYLPFNDRDIAFHMIRSLKKNAS
ncbi:MAG TPA: UDP-N-acetylmuramoyl-L-alanyl-D-glutamate--2,6-diaminopimelate ligase [Thermotogota bacterium]|nr:UDP-N-acetylmuramoyl-L-alanyl-D-glutamate--2,6-diaminopimelate ligase [Thermotogota bacterium]HRW92418.1 UDP-N-acetylmuramoyl-L-alanyl-D-glutamate--2,6-diaminopimelate ligase [Thermotogota bacterium]